MSISMQWPIMLTVIFSSCLKQYAVAQDVCSRLNIGGPCLLLQKSINDANKSSSSQPTDNPYCKLGQYFYCYACSQRNSQLFRGVCPCAANVTTAVYTTEATTPNLPTTTPRPVTCYYSSQRPARLNSISRRMYSSTPVATECDYPGVVGLFWENNGTMKLACMASLLEEDVLLINEKNCLMWIKRYPTFVLADSYEKSRVTKAISVDPATVSKLDTSGSLNSLYIVKLNSRLTLDSGCIQPICVPNINIPATDIDLDDCRLVGYGDTTDKIGSVSPELNEIKVRVNPSSITKATLTVTRTDNLSGMSCASDDSGPLICSHKITGEWVTIGVTITVGYKCSNPIFTKPVIASLFQEAPNKAYYNAIQKFKYADPNVFNIYMI